jgi:hypothetical protein
MKQNVMNFQVPGSLVKTNLSLDLLPETEVVFESGELRQLVQILKK